MCGRVRLADAPDGRGRIGGRAERTGRGCREARILGAGERRARDRKGVAGELAGKGGEGAGTHGGVFGEVVGRRALPRFAFVPFAVNPGRIIILHSLGHLIEVVSFGFFFYIQ